MVVVPWGIQMNQKDLTKIFIMILNWIKLFDLQVFYEIQRFKGWMLAYRLRRWPNIKHWILCTPNYNTECPSRYKLC